MSEKKPGLNTIEESAAGIASTLARMLPPDVGFVLALRSLKTPGWLSYVSSMDREDALRAMNDLVTGHYNGGMARITAERMRQQAPEREGGEDYDTTSDLRYTEGELAAAAICYEHCQGPVGATVPPARWPWHHKWFKPKGRIRNLERAGALYLAEQERLDREGRPSHHMKRAADRCANAIDQLLGFNASPLLHRAAESLAAACFHAIERGDIATRTPISDALESYAELLFGTRDGSGIRMLREKLAPEVGETTS